MPAGERAGRENEKSGHKGYRFLPKIADVLPSRLCDIAEKLENNVGNEHPGQVPALPGVQQGHVQHDDGNLPRLGQPAPLL